jgi:hypothetical protein
MLRKPRLILASAMLGTAVTAADVALAQLPGPPPGPGGPPPGPGPGGPPPDVGGGGPPPGPRAGGPPLVSALSALVFEQAVRLPASAAAVPRPPPIAAF